MTAQPFTTNTVKQQVVFLILEGVELLDLAGPAQVFSMAASLGAPYCLHFCGNINGAHSAQGLFLGQLETLPLMTADDLIVVAGVALDQLNPSLLDLATRDWLTDAHNRNICIASICTGALVLGEAGLLDGRRCTTHWFVVEDLQQRYPMAQVVDGVLYVRDRGIVTSAGIASGIDMALSLVEQQHGSRLATEVARHLVIYLRRNGTQPQQSVYLQYRNHLHSGIHQVQNWLAEHLTESISLTELAQIAHMSVRSFSRAFKEATGLTPIQYRQRLRLEVAATLLHSSELSIEAIAARCGFDDARHFRRLWQRYFGTAPSAMRLQQTSMA
jgi:transcriptional regulator GlxA family with amidase domain